MGNVFSKVLADNLAEIKQGKKIPSFRAGDTLRVAVRVAEGDKSRLQVFEGVCIARKNAGMGSSFTVRKISYGEGVERTFPLYSSAVESIKVIRMGKVRRAKLYYLKDRKGKSARIAEEFRAVLGNDNDEVASAGEVSAEKMDDVMAKPEPVNTEEGGDMEKSAETQVSSTLAETPSESETATTPAETSDKPAS